MIEDKTRKQRGVKMWNSSLSNHGRNRKERVQEGSCEW